MTFRSLGCLRFERLVSECEDRSLNPKEEAFVESHRARCDSCRATESSMHKSLNMLRSVVIEPQEPSGFDRRLIRRVKVQNVKDSFAYWMPALGGLVLAFLVVFTTIDLLAVRRVESSIRLPAGEASRNLKVYPVFELNHLPRFGR